MPPSSFQFHRAGLISSGYVTIRLCSLHFLLQPEDRDNTPTQTVTKACISTFPAAAQQWTYTAVSTAEQDDDTTTLSRQLSTVNMSIQVAATFIH